MKGAFEKILGKRIVGVIGRENDGDPPRQIFLAFDDNTYFEIYAYGQMKGINGILTGDMQRIRDVSAHFGKTVIDMEME